MRIVQFEDYFHPEAGYQPNVMSKYFVKAGHEVIIVCSEMDKVPEYLTSFFGKEDIDQKDREFEKRNGVKIIRVPLLGYISHRFIYSENVFKRIKTLHPDVLFIHENDSYKGIRVLMNPGKYSCGLIFDSHMLEMASTNRFSDQFRKIYRRFITPKIVKNNFTVIRTQDDHYVEKCLGIPLSQCPYIPLGSDILLFHRDLEERNQFRVMNNISGDALVFIYAGKLDETKGADILAQGIKKRFNTNREICFVIVGKATGEFGENVEAMFSESENRILRFPTQTYPDLAKFYQACDVAIFPKQCSLSFYDVQACGLPVVSEDNNINVERNSHGNGLCFKSGDVQDFRVKIQEMIDLGNKEFSDMSNKSEKYIMKNFNYAETANRYLAEIDAAYAHWK